MPESIARDTRIADVDALRGFALLGILVVNIGSFASAYYGSGVRNPAFATPLDIAVNAFVALFFETKFYLLFSFLFGYSFTLQMDSAARADAAFRPRIVRRCAGLFAIGVAHAVLLYQGDILTTYAVLGLVLFALRDIEPDRALRVAAWLVAASALVWLAIGALTVLGEVTLDAPEAAQAARDVEAAYRGTAAQIIAQRVEDLAGVVFLLAFVQGPSAFAMFLCGYVAGRRRLLVDALAQRDLFDRVWRAGLAVGLPCAVLYAVSSVQEGLSGWTLLALALDIATAPLLSAAYAALLLLVLHARGGDALRAWLAPAGRMALSNYLAQSLICAFVFTGYGLGLIGRVAPLPTLLFAFAIFAAQLVASRWWLRRYAYGPAEWLLRAVTLARLPALRR